MSALLSGAERMAALERLRRRVEEEFREASAEQVRAGRRIRELELELYALDQALNEARSAP